MPGIYRQAKTQSLAYLLKLIQTKYNTAIQKLFKMNNIPKPMEGTIVNFRGTRRVKKGNHMIVEVSSVDDKEKAAKLVGKKVVWKTSAGKPMNGKVASAHGNSGALRVIFETGMPGQSIGTKVSIE